MDALIFLKIKGIGMIQNIDLKWGRGVSYRHTTMWTT